MVQIGRCLGCANSAKLDNGVCAECLNRHPGDPEKSRKWANIADRCRKDPETASRVYSQIMNMRAREIFIEMFGLPPGQEAPEKEEAPGPHLRLVK